MNKLSTMGLFFASVCAIAQNGGSAVTQVLIGVDAQSGHVPALSDVTLKVNGKPQPLTGWSRVPPDQLQIAVLIDNNRLKKEVGDHLDSLQGFAMALAAGAQIYIGYMGDSGIHTEQGFTNDHAYAAERFRRPSGITEITPSPFTCLSTFVKAWPVKPSHPAARFVLLLTDGFDFRPGFADSALDDALRAGVVVFTVFMNDRVSAREMASHSSMYSHDAPLDDLDKVTGGTGGHAYYELGRDELPLSVYLDRFRATLASTYVASVGIPSTGGKMMQLKIETKLPGVKLVAPKAIMPGNLEVSSIK